MICFLYQQVNLDQNNRVGVRGGRTFATATSWRATEGRKICQPKEAVNLRLDADVLEFFRNTGPGWQFRINEALRKRRGCSA